ncbi:spore germination protein [Thermotalea metallivorans]|uniref:Spore germination protein A1 n=1 Tax=Thermotalea metallivorans TaxID=520762 RepID=A0A140L021_9FIRM|nr:spore germination protein [Thermotalea metallivorans]KXG73896.1 Spore germination protein A1 [Thermotalea metallivorans]
MREMKEKDKRIMKIEALCQGDQGISMRKLWAMGVEVHILYIPQLTDRKRLSHDIIKPILEYHGKEVMTIDMIAAAVVYIDDISMDEDEEKIIDYILDGYSVILMANSKKYMIANTLKIEKRNVESPEIQNTLRGPKDAFTENYEANLSLIRYRIKDPALRIQQHAIGRRTKTRVAVIYIEDIVNHQYVEKINRKLQEIRVDGILASGHIEKFIVDNAFSLFPQAGTAERSDRACASILKGMICMIVEGSNIALIVPYPFMEFLDAGEDHYDNIFLAVLLKWVRIIALLITLTLSSLYIAVVAFHPDILPARYILALASTRVMVPVNVALETFIMEIVAEILREASTRLPKQIGPAIGIVGTIVIGQAAVGAGLVSPLMVVVISLVTMASFLAPDHTIMNPIRILRFPLIIVTAIFGLLGFVLGLTMIMIKVISMKSLGVPYFTPMVPFNLTDLKDYLFSDVTLAKKRPKFLNTRDKTRQ